MATLRRAPWTALLGLLSFVLVGQAPDLPLKLPLSRVARDLAVFGFSVTTGAASGYVDEATCSLCHPKIVATYAAKGMARAFQRPRRETDREDFAAPPFVHAPSGQHLQIDRHGDRLVFRRWQIDTDGKPIHRVEQEIAWILGSGDHARTYLYQTPAGEIYQLPLAWYTQERRWGMAPGFDRQDHEGVLRRVRRECLFCHTSFPDVAAGADSYGAPQVFPARLPEGVGCQRCHGPAAEHVWLSLGGIGPREEIQASVFNPGRLPVAQRDEVCMSCHLQPSVALPGVRRFGRADFSFQAGEPVANYFVQVDPDEENRQPGERFEINHHPYRLRQSRCFLASGGGLSCLTCHDPHQRVPDEQRAAHYRSACRTCHEAADCRRPEKATHVEDDSDCAACHMPKRRTQDVVHVVMTDHLIRRPGGADLLAPLTESEPVLTGVRLADPQAPQGSLGEVYRAAAVVRVVATAPAVERLEKMLAAVRPAEVDPWLDLAQGQLKRQRFADAERALGEVLTRSPDHLLALEWLALARAGQGKADEAITILERLVSASGPERPEAEFNLGRLLTIRDRVVEGEKHLRRALAARPNLVAAWYRLGEIQASSGNTADALACWRRALEIDPTHTASYLALGKTLLAQGERAEALRWLRHGAKAAANPVQVAEALRLAENPSR